jgi:hypothetical protein
VTAAGAFVLRHQLALVAAAAVLAVAGFAVQVAATRRRERRQDEAIIAAIRADAGREEGKAA